MKARRIGKKLVFGKDWHGWAWKYKDEEVAGYLRSHRKKPTEWWCREKDGRWVRVALVEVGRKRGRP